MVDLRSIVGGQNYNAPSLDLIPLVQMGHDITRQGAIDKSLLQRNYRTRLIPDIASQFAGQGAFYSGGRINAQGRALQDTLTGQNQIQANVDQRMRELINAAGLIPFGRGNLR